MTVQCSTMSKVRIQFYVECFLKQKIWGSKRKRQSERSPATVLLHFFLIKYYQSSYWNGVSELFPFTLQYWHCEHQMMFPDTCPSATRSPLLFKWNEWKSELMQVNLSVQIPSLTWREGSPDLAIRILQSRFALRWCRMTALFSLSHLDMIIKNKRCSIYFLTQYCIVQTQISEISVLHFMQGGLFFFLPDKPEWTKNGIFLQIYVQGNQWLNLWLTQVFFHRVYTYSCVKKCVLKLGFFSPSRTWKKTLNKSDSRIGKTKKS